MLAGDPRMLFVASVYFAAIRLACTPARQSQSEAVIVRCYCWGSMLASLADKARGEREKMY